MPSPAYSSLEPLEQRIAPASLVLSSTGNPNETITITTSHGSIANLISVLSGTGLTGTHFLGDRLEFNLDFTGHSVFQGTDLTVTAAGGASLFLHELDASGYNLGRVSIHGGDLGMIVAGAGTATAAVRLLQVESLGGTAALHSQIRGPLSALEVSGNIDGTLELTGRFGSLSSGHVQGNLAGGDGAESGSIQTSGSIGNLTIDGDLRGGSGERSGSVFAGPGGIGRISLHSLTGGTGFQSGDLNSLGNVGHADILGSITGSASTGSAASSGRVSVGGHLTQVRVAGSILGGAGDSSGSITSVHGIGSVLVLGALVGGAGQESGAIGSVGSVSSLTLGTLSSPAQDVLLGGSGERSGSLLSSTSLGAMVINGNVVGGSGLNSGNIGSGGTIGSVVVHGSVTGGSGEESGALGSKRAFSSAAIDGQLVGGSGADSGRVVSAATLSRVLVSGDVRGGTGFESGAIGSLGTLGTVHLAGQLVGGVGDRSGSVLSAGSIGSVTADLTVLGGQGVLSGSIFALGRLGSVTLHRSLNGRLGGSQSAEIRSEQAIGTVSIDGSVIGGASPAAGSILSFGPIDQVTVGGELDGGGTGTSGTNGGSIVTSREIVAGGDGPVQGPANPLGYRIGTVTVGVSIVGGEGQGSGSVISAGTIGKVQVRSALRAQVAGPGTDPGTVSVSQVAGGDGFGSGSIRARGNIDSVVIYGSLGGGFGDESGTVESTSGRLTSVFLQGSMSGAGGFASGSLRGSAIGAVEIDGDVTGTGHDSGSIIATGTDISRVQIGGTLGVSSDGDGPVRIAAERNLGSVTAFAILGQASAPVVISAGGNGSATNGAAAVAIGSVRTTEYLSFTDILAGYAGTGGDSNGTVDGLAPVHGHVSIGTVEAGTSEEIARPWEAVNIIAGVTRSGFESQDLSGGNPRLPSVIAQIIVHGQLVDLENGERYYVIADQLTAATVNGTALTLHAGPHNDAGTLDKPTGTTTTYFEVGTALGEGL